ncbi:XRE family transcriptional regulator [Leptolyngbya sp. FACHB-17]|uniref:XRE family transcriptional regulator n=1 Tax=unclassified Leptolyngbya TaxID=2650499 RepID=UPI0016805FD2|nr:XRE family transcriptional regulator [Leptolyngbya sp. FACHB-17]MBD2082016.1 hypothetical protein [Leptolyngbya sp. FACHB-17]
MDIRQAVQQLGATEDQVEALLQGDIEQFRIEPLIAVLANVGMKAHVEVLPNVA